jgi:pre-mRNA-splicing factor CWC22
MPYVPPHKRKREDNSIDKFGEAQQRLSFESLRRYLNGVVNKANGGNIVTVLPELFKENLVRGRGLLCRALLSAQEASPSYTPVYASLISVINAKLPEVGELLVKRVVSGFRDSFSQSNKLKSVALARFLAHLVNQRVCHELIALQIAALLLERPTDDSIEVAIGFCKECGALLTEVCPSSLNAIFDRFRSILNGDVEREEVSRTNAANEQRKKISERGLLLVEALFRTRKGKFSEHPTIPQALDLVEEADQITHELSLDDEIDIESNLDSFEFDPAFEKHEMLWTKIRGEILGEDSTDVDVIDKSDVGGGALIAGGDDADLDDAQVVDSSDAVVSSSSTSDNVAPPTDVIGFGQGSSGSDIVDLAETDLVNLRRTIYLTIMSSVDYEECAHKLMKLSIPRGAEGELCNMLVECCSQERTFMRYYGLLAQRFCMISQTYQALFEKSFEENYTTIHRLDTNKLRNVAKFFAHLLHSDALPWTVFEKVKLTEETTTSSGRIFIKVVFQELSEYMGLRKLRDRMFDPFMDEPFSGLFPKDSLRNTRFSINFFTSIGLGALTDLMRDYLAEEQTALLKQAQDQTTA